MSDSDSQQQQHFNLRKLPEEQQPHIKEILQKGKKILPSYDDESLYGLFKRYYCVENIFLNELNIIAKRAKGDHDNDDRKKDQKWIKVGREVKTKVNKTKYNFLEDKQLLRRAEQYLKNKKLAPERRENFGERKENYGERKDVERRPQQRKRQNYQQPQQGTYNNRSAQNQRPKQKFVEKVQDVKKETQQQQPAVVHEEKKVETKKKQSPVKEQKYKEKVQPTTTVTKVQPTTTTTSKAEHKQQEQKQPVHQQPKQAEHHQQQKPQTQQHNVSKHEEKKHQPSHHEPAKQQPHKKQQNVKHHVKSTHHEQKKAHENHHEKQHPVKKETVSHHHEKQPATQASKQESSHSIPTVQNFDPLVAGENFKQACNQNSFVLKFIQPQAYPQRISYVRTADGGMKNVQIRVTGTSTQGSQKAL